MTGFSEILRGINGTIELNRLSLFLAVVGYVLGTLAFQGWALWDDASRFDVTAFCLSFGGGFAALIGGGAGAVAIKDRNVAASKVIEETGSKPATPPNPAPKLQQGMADANSGEAPAIDERPAYAR